ncbi:hypothetical protein GCM10022206_89570 [Streptomyces chiangmaiensis]
MLLTRYFAVGKRWRATAAFDRPADCLRTGGEQSGHPEQKAMLPGLSGSEEALASAIRLWTRHCRFGRAGRGSRMSWSANWCSKPRPK